MSIEENLNNNIGLEQIKEFEAIYSDSYLPKCADIEIFSELPDSIFEVEMTEKKEAPEPSSPTPVVEVVEVKTENKDEEMAEFDLIKFIIFGDVSRKEIEEFDNFSNKFILL